MPKPDYVSITIRRITYDLLYEQYNSRRDDLFLRGINSFTAYLVYLAQLGLKLEGKT